MRSLIAAVIAGFIMTSLLGISGALLILFVYNKLAGKPAA